MRGHTTFRMNACVHSWLEPGSRFITKYIIDGWQGPTDAILECTRCGQHALLQLLHWQGRNLSKRVYAVSPLPEAATLIFLKDMNTDYCDLARHKAEVDALLAAKGPPESVIGVDLDARAVIAVGEPALIEQSPRSWRDCPPDETSPAWLDFLHGEK